MDWQDKVDTFLSEVSLTMDGLAILLCLRYPDQQDDMKKIVRDVEDTIRTDALELLRGQ